VVVTSVLPRSPSVRQSLPNASKDRCRPRPIAPTHALSVIAPPIGPPCTPDPSGGIFLGSNSQAIGRVESHLDLTRTAHRLAAFALTGLTTASGSRRLAVGAAGVLVVGLGVAAAISDFRREAWLHVTLLPALLAAAGVALLLLVRTRCRPG
jgi:hypothetical protein